MADGLSPEVKSALQLGMVAELVMLGVGGVIAFVTDQMFWIVIFALMGSAVMLFLMARAGAFKKGGQ